jgi:DNA-binding IclR family transcriptional regulator
LTSHTKINLESFLKELEEVRVNGYAVSDEELQLGVQGVACPIFDYNGKVIGSVSYTALKSDNSLIDENIKMLKECALNISKSIGAV